MADQTLKFILDVTYNGSEIKQFNVDLAGVVDKAKNAESALVKTGNGFVTLSGASKNAVSALDGLGISTVALTDPMYAVGSAVKYAIDQAAESQKVMSQTEAVIKSTGGAAGLSAEQISKMAESLSMASTFSDDAIQQGENLLLTFTNIGGDVFPSATQAMLDMATAMGTDAKGGAIQLGKALNDPVAGISALSRVGVTFTEDQKKVIKSMVEMGDTAGAQKIILAELNKEFGGSAAAAADTYAGRMARMQNAIDNMAEAAAQAPIAGRGLLDWLSDAAEGATLLLTYTQRVDGALADHAGTVKDTAGSYEDYATELKRAADAAGYAIDAEGNLTRTFMTSSGPRKEVVETNYLLTKSEFNVGKETEARAAAETKAAAASKDLAAADADAAAKAEETAAKAKARADQMVLSAALSGKLAGINNNYIKTISDTNDALAATQAELDKYTASQGQAVYSTSELEKLHQNLAEAQAKEADTGNDLWQAQQNLNDNTDPEKQAQLADAVSRAQLAYDGAALSTRDAAQAFSDAGAAVVDNSQKIDDLTKKHDELIAKQKEAEAQAKKQTNQFIFDQASVGLDTGAQLELANSLGLIDEKSYNAAKAVLDLKNQFDKNHDGSITAAEGADKYAQAVATLADRINNGLQDRTVTVTYQEQGTDLVEATAAQVAAIQDKTVTITYVQGEATYDGKRAGGGPVESGKVYQVNETPGVGPEYFVPGMNGYMLNQSQAQAAMAGGGAGSGSGGRVSNMSISGVTINNGMDQAAFMAMLRRALI